MACLACKKEGPEIIDPESIYISKSSLYMITGDVRYLNVTVLPANATDKSFTWISSDSTVASIHNGSVNALSPGVVSITAICGDGLEAVCEVTVVSEIPSSLSLLHTEGNLVKNEAGESIMLRGTNLGSWLVQEDWMTGNTTGCQKDMIETLTARFGKEVCGQLIDIWEDNFIKETDIDNIKNIGLNCIRVPFTFMNLVELEDYEWKDDAFERLDWIVRECGERGLYVILDMHGAPGSQNGSDHSGIDGGDAKEAASAFFFGTNAAINQDKFYKIWEQIAMRYEGNNTVAGYDLLNEPFCTWRYSSALGQSGLHNLLFPIYNEAYKRIRAIDDRHIIIMEATWDPWDLPNPSIYSWSNIIYQYHNYQYSDYDNANGEQITSMTNKLDYIMDYDNSYNVPNLLGEFCYMNNPAAWREGMALLNSYGVHWTTWSYKVKEGNGNWGIYTCPSYGVNVSTALNSEIRSKWADQASAKNTSLYMILSEYAQGKTDF